MRPFQRRPPLVDERDTRIAQLENRLVALRIDVATANRHAVVAARDAKETQISLEETKRHLDAELAENKRLNQVINQLLRDRQVSRLAGDSLVSLDDPIFLRAELDRHKANATRLEDRLAVAEGRVTYAGRPA
jgi:chaperonin cofactor prefoldin